MEKIRRYKYVVTLIIAVFFVVPSGYANFSGLDRSEELLFSNETHVQVVDDALFVWEDTFDNSYNIDFDFSNNILVENGAVSMIDTFPQWNNPLWDKMKPISIQSPSQIQNCILKFEVEYDSDMQTDYDDIRFTYEDDPIWLSFWIEEKNPVPNDPYAVFWVKIPLVLSGSSKMYMFYGNPSATDESDYWAIFDENSWQNTFTHDQQLTFHWEGEGAWDPDVCFGDDKFFVTWEEGTPFCLIPPMLFQQQIRGCIYDENGDVIVSRFDITAVEDPPYRYENPSVATNNDIFFVVFEHFTNPLTNQYNQRDIQGAIVSGNGNVINRFDICTMDNIQADPIVCYDDENDRFFVVWEDGRSGTDNYDLYAKIYTPQGNLVGSEISISTRPNSQCEPEITYDNLNNHFFIVWEEGIDPANGPFDIWGQLFDVNGNGIGNAQRISPVGESSIDYNFPDVCFSALKQRFIVTWQQDDISVGDWYGHIWGKIFDLNANIVVDAFKIAHGEFERTRVVPYLSSMFFIAYDGGGEIWGSLVSDDGFPNPYNLQLSDIESSPADWPAIASNGDFVFITWEDTRIIYPEPYESLNMPDIYFNICSFNSPDAADLTTAFEDEKSLILDATVTSVEIIPDNILRWHRFYADSSGDISFDILDGSTLQVLKSDVSNGVNLEDISSDSIRLKGYLSRSNPSTSPILNKWNVSYVGEDEVPPQTSIDHIDGENGQNGWYLSECITLWLYAEDFPVDNGIGVDETYYTVNNGGTQLYDENTGIHLCSTESTQWMGQWTVVFWSVDKAGNVEEKNEPENSITLKIDADIPFVEIIEPTDEEQVESPFWVRAEASDNVGVVKVEFDIEPFGEREGLPFVDTQPPFEWYCEEEESLIKQLLNEYPAGTNVMVRAKAYDEAGHTWIHEIWVYITNWYDADDSIGSVFVFALGLNNERSQDRLINLVNNDISWSYRRGFSIFLSRDGLSGRRDDHSIFADSFKGISIGNRNLIIGICDKINFT
jgi:hypothetical protein